MPVFFVCILQSKPLFYNVKVKRQIKYALKQKLVRKKVQL